MDAFAFSASDSARNPSSPKLFWARNRALIAWGSRNLDASMDKPVSVSDFLLRWRLSMASGVLGKASS